MRVRFSPEAFADRERIFEYLSARSPSGARNVLASIRAAVVQLAWVARLWLPGSLGLASFLFLVFGFGLFGSTTLIPQMLQSLYGYCAIDAGMAEQRERSRDQDRERQEDQQRQREVAEVPPSDSRLPGLPDPDRAEERGAGKSFAR